MESALSVTVPTLALFSIPRALNRHFYYNNSSLIARCIRSRLFPQGRGVTVLASRSYSSPLRSLCAAPVPQRLRRRLECVANSAAYFGTAGGGGDGSGSGGGGGGGGEGTGDGDLKAKLGAGAVDEPSALSADIIILDVGVWFPFFYSVFYS